MARPVRCGDAAVDVARMIDGDSELLDVPVHLRRPEGFEPVRGVEQRLDRGDAAAVVYQDGEAHQSTSVEATSITVPRGDQVRGACSALETPPPGLRDWISERISTPI